MRYLIISLILLSLASCSNTSSTTTGPSIETDSISYELMVLDNGFELYLETIAKPMNFYSQTYYETWNRQYCTIWNSRYFERKNPELYGSSIAYETNVDYGLELNYQLYNYFQFFERENELSLIQRKGRP